MCILASVVNKYVHTCVGFERVCVYVCRFWMTMCILASVFDDYVHNCIGFEQLCDDCFGLKLLCV